MSMSKGHVYLFFERNPALGERRTQVLRKLRNSDWLDEDDVRKAMGDELFRLLEFDMSQDKPLRGKTNVMGHVDSYMSQTLAYVP